MDESYQFIDPSQLARISDLELLARTTVEGLLTGLHKSPHTGSAIEFAQYRPYAQGDDPRHIDWHLYARTDRLRIKQFQEETNLRCTLLFDCSASMNYGSGSVTKFQYARMLAACLSMLLQTQRDSIGLVAYHHDLLEYMPPRSSAHHVRRMLLTLDGLKPEGQTDTAGALHYLGDVLRPRGMVILISDLLHPLDDMIDHLKSLRARRHDVVVFQVSDPAEQEFPFDQSQTFIDLETGAEQFAVPDNVREVYLENRRVHFEEIRKACVSSEIELAEFTTAEPLDHALHRFLQRRSRSLLTSSSASRKSGRGGN